MRRLMSGDPLVAVHLLGVMLAGYETNIGAPGSSLLARFAQPTRNVARLLLGQGGDDGPARARKVTLLVDRYTPAQIQAVADDALDFICGMDSITVIRL